MNKVHDNQGLLLWSKVEKTPKQFTKQVSFGKRKYTTIQAQYQIKQATIQWGPYGGEWGVKDCNYTYLKDNVLMQSGAVVEKIVELTLDAVFYYPGGEFEISADIKYSPGGDCKKKVLTDLTTKALSKLGFSADIFMDGKTDNSFQDNKYVNPVKEDKRAQRRKARMNEKQFETLLKRIEGKDKDYTEKQINLANDHYEITEEQSIELANILTGFE